MAFRKLPPDVVRELRRHVAPRPLEASRSQPQQLSSQSPSSLHYVLGGCLALLTTAASFPLVATWWISLNDREGALTKTQIRRGAFNNSGSTDVGRDPDWDFKTGTHKFKAGYDAMLMEDEGDGKEGPRKRLPPEFHAMAPETLQKHERKMLDFAHGKAKNDG